MTPKFIRDAGCLYVAGLTPGTPLVSCPVWEWDPMGRSWFEMTPEIWTCNDDDDWADSFGFHDLSFNDVASRWPEAVAALPQLGFELPSCRPANRSSGQRDARMPVKFSETPWLEEPANYNPAQARERLRQLEDPQEFDQTDPGLQALKEGLVLAANRRDPRH